MRAIILHHNDLDGCCAGAIAYHTISRAHPDMEVIIRSVDYKDTYPLDLINPGDKVYMLDFTPKPPDFMQVLDIVGIDNVVWLDHHKTNIDRIIPVLERSPFDESKIQGKRSDTFPSAAQLAWEWFQESPPGRLVRLVDQWDTWTHDDHPSILDCVWGAKLMGMDVSAKDPMWMGMFDFKQEGAVLDILTKQGAPARKFEAKQAKTRMDHHGFDVQVPNQQSEYWKGRAINCGLINSFAFESCKDQGYDVWVSFYFDGNQYTVSLYKADSDKTLQLGAYAAKMGGGGHDGAAGFQCQALPGWLKLT